MKEVAFCVPQCGIINVLLLQHRWAYLYANVPICAGSFNLDDNLEHWRLSWWEWRVTP